MICPHIVNVSMMLGSIITWGFLWPYIDSKAGAWFPAGLNEHDFSGLFGYKACSLAPRSCPLHSTHLRRSQQCCKHDLHAFKIVSQLNR
jgi:hypothetical protein